MTTRSIRLVAYLVLLLALGTGVSLAASGPTKVAAANPAPVAFCPTDPSLAQSTNYSHINSQSDHFSLSLLRKRRKWPLQPSMLRLACAADIEDLIGLRVPADILLS